MSVKLVDAVVAIVRQGERFLFVKRSQTVWSAPGYWTPISGHLEPNETQAQAVQREVNKEVGLEVTTIQKVGELLSPDGRYRLYYWVTKIRGGQFRVCRDEATALTWVSVAEMRQLHPRFDDDIAMIEGLAP